MTALDILGGLFGAPLFAGLLCLPRRWRDWSWFATWWVFAAGWQVFWCAVTGDVRGGTAAGLSLGAAGVVLFARWAREWGEGTG